MSFIHKIYLHRIIYALFSCVFAIYSLESVAGTYSWSSGDYTNASGNTISGDPAVEGSGVVLGTFNNNGIVSSSTSTGYGFWFYTLGTSTQSIVNAGSIDGGRYGIKYESGTSLFSLVNTGTISSSINNTDSVAVATNGTITSIENSGSIIGVSKGIGNTNGYISSINNSGTISASGITGDAIYIKGLGSIGSITNTGSLVGTHAGINNVGGALGTITNSGTITASGGDGAAVLNTGILTSLTNSGTISGRVAIASVNSIGTITNSGTIDGDINISGQDVTILGGSGSTVGALKGGTITLDDGKNLTFGSGNQLLADNIDVGTGTVTNEGSLYLNSVQSITGSYAQTSTSTYNSSVAGQLNVSDTANLTGTFNATGGNGINGINGNTRWTVLTATNGLNGSTFSNVSSDLDLVNFALAYDANNVYMTAQAHYTSAATNQNQLAVASSLQSAFYSSPSTAGQSVLDKINPMSASQAQTAFNSLSGEGISAQQTANFTAANLVVDASRRQANYWLMDECQTGASSKKNKAASHNALPTTCASNDNRQFRSWMTGVGASNSLDGSSSVGSASVSTQTGGGIVGFDYEVSSHLLVGGMVGGTSSNYNVSARSSTGTDSSGQVGLYSVAKWEKFYVNTIFNYGYFSGDTKRYVNGLGATTEQTGKTSSNAFTGRAEVGYRMDHPLVNLMPFIAMQATSLQMNSFTESNTNNLGLSVAGNTTMSEPGSLGVQLDHSFDINDKWSLYPLLRMAWVHEFQTDRSINASLQALPTTNWTVNGASAASNAANIGITVQAMSKHGVAVFASGNTETSSSTQSYMGELGVKWLF